MIDVENLPPNLASLADAALPVHVGHAGRYVCSVVKGRAGRTMTMTPAHVPPGCEKRQTSGVFGSHVPGDLDRTTVGRIADVLNAIGAGHEWSSSLPFKIGLDFLDGRWIHTLDPRFEIQGRPKSIQGSSAWRWYHNPGRSLQLYGGETYLYENALFYASCLPTTPNLLFTLRTRTADPAILDEACDLLNELGYVGAPDFFKGICALRWSHGVAIFQVGGHWIHVRDRMDLVSILASMKEPPLDPSTVEAACRILPALGTDPEADGILATYLGAWTSTMNVEAAVETLDMRQFSLAPGDDTMRLTLSIRVCETLSLLDRMDDHLRELVVAAIRRLLERTADEADPHGKLPLIREAFAATVPDAVVVSAGSAGAARVDPFGDT